MKVMEAEEDLMEIANTLFLTHIFYFPQGFPEDHMASQEQVRASPGTLPPAYCWAFELLDERDGTMVSYSHVGFSP